MENLTQPYLLRELYRNNDLELSPKQSKAHCQNFFFFGGGGGGGGGILANRFRIFLSPMLLLPQNVGVLTFGCCTLHNFLCDKTPSRKTPSGSFDNTNL